MTENTFRECPYDNHSSLPCPAKDVDALILPVACSPGEYGRKCGEIVMQIAVLDGISEEGDYPELFRGTRTVDRAVSEVKGAYPRRAIQDVQLPE